MARRNLRAAVLGLVGLAVAGWRLPAQAKGEWPPISQEELAMKDNPMSPGSAAMILYREMISDHPGKWETHYYRIKVFTDAGKKYADVEVPYHKGYYELTDIKARTIHADGKVMNLEKPPFDKVVVKSRRVSFMAKTFTLPDVQVGSILEYRYTIKWAEGYLPNPPTWYVQHELFTRKAHFSVKAAKTYTPQATVFGTASAAAEYAYYEFQENICGRQSAAKKTSFGFQGVAFVPRGYPQPQSSKEGVVQLDVENILGLQGEEYMPPADELKARVLFYYTTHGPEDFQEFWKRTGGECNSAVEEFMGKDKGVREAAAALGSPADSPEAKLRKLYARAQQIRNLSFESSKRGPDLKRNLGAEDALSRGYGDRFDITRLFVALARAAGFEASVVRVPERDEAFFHVELLDWDQLSSEVALVSSGNQAWWLDPGTPMCPFGLLSWEKTGVSGLKLGLDGGTFVQTPKPASKDAVTERKADLKLDPDGTVRGSITLTLSGLRALQRRLDAINTDEVGRRKAMADRIKAMLPSTAQLKLGTIEGWDKPDGPLVVQASVEIPGFGTATGRRLLLPLALFQVNDKHPFQPLRRTFSIYFRYPFEERDEVQLALPAGYTVESVPAPAHGFASIGSYEISREKQEGGVRLRRLLKINETSVPPTAYPDVRGLYDKVVAGDGEQVVVRNAQAEPH